MRSSVRILDVVLSGSRKWYCSYRGSWKGHGSRKARRTVECVATVSDVTGRVTSGLTRLVRTIQRFDRTNE